MTFSGLSVSSKLCLADRRHLSKYAWQIANSMLCGTQEATMASPPPFSSNSQYMFVQKYCHTHPPSSLIYFDANNKTSFQPSAMARSSIELAFFTLQLPPTKPQPNSKQAVAL
jgi:hypothetical protein